MSTAESRRIRDYIPFSSIIIVVVLLVANFLIPLPYSVLSPGSATSVTPLVEVPEAQGYDHTGNFLYTTVSVQSQAHPFDIVWAWLLPDRNIEKREAVTGDVSNEEYKQLNNAAMDQSKKSAIMVAMTRAGYDVQVTGDGALVIQIAEGSPAEGRLNAGDVITKVNGDEVLQASDATDKVGALAPGAVATFDVKNSDGQMRTEEITLATRPDDATKAYLGVGLSTSNEQLITPFEVDIAIENVGGPSAGLAFTLAVLDQLTPGDLTGGSDVALTGTMNPDGTVGPVGGVEYKAKAVSRSDAKLFLVPADEYDDAADRVDDDVKVVGVASLQEALDAIAANGGDVSGIPPVTEAAAA